MSGDDPKAPLPFDLRLLRVLVLVLMVVMILGLLTLLWLLVTRLSPAAAPLPALPDSVILPEDARPAAVTFSRDWLVVVTEGGEVLLYPGDGGRPVARVQPAN